MPDNVRDALGETTLKPSPPEAMETICETVEDAIVCEVKKKKTLAYDLAAQEKIKELWQQTPRPSYAEIANVGFSWRLAEHLKATPKLFEEQ